MECTSALGSVLASIYLKQTLTLQLSLTSYSRQSSCFQPAKYWDYRPKPPHLKFFLKFPYINKGTMDESNGMALGWAGAAQWLRLLSQSQFCHTQAGNKLRHIPNLSILGCTMGIQHAPAEDEYIDLNGRLVEPGTWWAEEWPPDLSTSYSPEPLTVTL